MIKKIFNFDILSSFQNTIEQKSIRIYAKVVATAAKPKGVGADYISKIWSNYKETTEKNIKCMIQFEEIRY